MQTVASDRAFAMLSSLENSGKQRRTATCLLFFRSRNRQRPRISAADEMSFAVDFVEEQRKTAGTWISQMKLPAGDRAAGSERWLSARHL
jgi:uncharacterized protein YcbX